MLHVRCGGDIIEKLQAAGLPGDFLVWADPVSQGPAPDLPPGDAWHEVRAGFVAHAYGADAQFVRADMAAADARLAAAARREEIVLWLEHDIYDQAVLIQLLARLALGDLGEAGASLVCIGSHPEIPRFIGLGNLTSAQLRPLFPRRVPLTRTMLDAGAAAWHAFTAPDPLELFALSSQRFPGMPFLPAALVRHLRELPSTASGTSRTEWLALQAVAAGADTAGRAFIEVQAREEAPWLGDAMFYHVLARLGRMSEPLIDVRADWPADAATFADAPIALTDAGRAVLAGAADAVALSGIDRWVGGVALQGRAAAWRWDEARRRPVPG